jgi:ethanolamine utilization protein EutP
MIRQWMENTGCDRIFEVNNKTREGIDELLAYLNDDLPSISMDEAIERQRLGLSEWDPYTAGERS